MLLATELLVDDRVDEVSMLRVFDAIDVDELGDTNETEELDKTERLDELDIGTKAEIMRKPCTLFFTVAPTLDLR